MPQASAAVLDLAREMDALTDTGAEAFVTAAVATVHETLHASGIEA
jgi:hypothetical protein